MTDKAVALIIRESFPKHTPGALSYALNTAQSGVMLCPKAQRIYDTLRPPKKKRVYRRVKSSSSVPDSRRRRQRPLNRRWKSSASPASRRWWRHCSSDG